MSSRVRLNITGIVQGVGFRPHVYNLAASLNLQGFVLNTSKGVIIEVEGAGAEAFSDTLLQTLPPLASIKTLETETLPPAGYGGFEIRLSESSEGEFALVSPDIATCPDCLREIYDPADRRYLYPFINCTNCGPRYSIVHGVPYDRPLTTMREFKMCPACRAEYNDPADRRFHAQPVACPACGPKPEAGVGADSVAGDDPLESAIAALMAGKVLALKGLGGFQLACDAKNNEAVSRLRDRKRKSRKPFALMARDIEAIRRYCDVSTAEEGLLASRAAPIVLLKKKPHGEKLPEAVAPGNNLIGFMLPYTPLHHLLFRHPAFAPDDTPEILVMTSGNLSEEPIVIDNADALQKLKGLADCFLLHDRGIYMRVDDSVARVVSDVPRLIRRARGYVPEPIDLGREMPEILACGGELKNTLCLTKANYAIPSQHIGDLTNYEAMAFFEETLKNLKRTFKADPRFIAHDMHPDYLSTRFAQGYRPERGEAILVPVQHHHAHIAACMAENGETGKAIGVAFDGTGYGTDGNSWGSEFMIADLSGFERFAHLNYIQLPGGDRAVREPWRIALSLLVQAYGGAAINIFRQVKGGIPDEAPVVLQMLEKRINSPLSSGMGRLFDGVSSLIGLRDSITFEGEAAIALEMAAEETEGIYPYSLSGGRPVVIDTAPLVRAIVDDIKQGVAKGVIAGRFHNTVAHMIERICFSAQNHTGISTVALSGGVFQNAILFGKAEKLLIAHGFRLLTHSKLPTNDACISLGQAIIATEKMKLKESLP